MLKKQNPLHLAFCMLNGICLNIFFNIQKPNTDKNIKEKHNHYRILIISWFSYQQIKLEEKFGIKMTRASESR